MINPAKYKIIIYINLFFLFCFFFFVSDLNFEIEYLKKHKLIVLILSICIIIGLICLDVVYIKHIDLISDKIKMIILFVMIFVFFIILPFIIITFRDELLKIKTVSKYIFYVLSVFTYLFVITMFIFDIEKKFNIEFFMSLEFLVLFMVYYIIFSYFSLQKIYYQLKNNDFSTLSTNCFINNNPDVNQIANIAKQYGDSYLKTIGDIPISFFNKNNNNYQDLILADFYYPGSYYSYLSTTPLNGIPSLEALKLSLTKFKTRIVHLDIFSNMADEHSPSAKPVVRCKNMKEGAEPLDLLACFGTINKFAFSEDKSYPLFLYLNFNFEENESMYIKISDMVLKVFSKRLIDKKYIFSGRNGTFPVSKATMKECLNKIVIITNTYPTKCILDEIINGSTNDLNHDINMNEYKDSYITYDKVGLSQDFNKNDLVNSSKLFLNLFYTVPNIKYKNDNQAKAGLFNPSFQDCAQYGVQSTLMYLFVPDDNLNNWHLYFKNKNNFNPVLKDESLRFINSKDLVIVKQDPVLGLQAPQKYCIIPGIITTEKSNISGNPTNLTC